MLPSTGRSIEELHRVRSTSPLRREWLVPDIEISVGYMHSEYPIMTWPDFFTVDSYYPVVPLLQMEVTFLE